jgi:alkylation response protein AidB-like acyl-CoA dehydrogenase
LLNNARAIAEQTPGDDGASLWDDAAFQRKYAALDCALTAVEWTEWRIVQQLAAGKVVGDAPASMLKLSSSEVQQRVTELAVEALGPYAAPDQRSALHGNAGPIGPDHALTPTGRYLNARAATIFGGSSEVQRNILARLAVGL